YLENQVFAPAVAQGHGIIWARGAALTGRPYLARAAEEHSGPHMPWFWQGKLQGGGVLNDMMGQSGLVVRPRLTKRSAPLGSVRPARGTGDIASLKWSGPAYAKRLQQQMGKDVDYSKAPSEDFAGVTIEFETEKNATVIGEASTSWCFVGAGLRLSAELLGPEYSMSWNTLDSGLKLFFSREVKGKTGEDLVEKQNAEMGLMPVVTSESATYGYDSDEPPPMARPLHGSTAAAGGGSGPRAATGAAPVRCHRVVRRQRSLAMAVTGRLTCQMGRARRLCGGRARHGGDDDQARLRLDAAPHRVGDADAA